MTDLGEAVLRGGLDRPHFFNGRVLTAEDLAHEQEASTRQHRRVGRAMGDGVVGGLWVRADGGGDDPTVTVTGGTAITRLGDVVEIPDEVVTVRLVSQPTDAERPPARAAFDVCAPPRPRYRGRGLYLLCVGPAVGDVGRAPRVGFGTGEVADGCGPRSRVSGYQLRLVPLDVPAVLGVAGIDGDGLPDAQDAIDLTSQSLLRNVVAHAFLGTSALRDLLTDPFAPSAAVDPVDALLAAGRLSPCDVPLALVLWRGGTVVDFVDNWAVRRTPRPRGVPGEVVDVLLGEERHGRGTAVLCQFAEQVSDLVARSPGAVARPLPVIGLVGPTRAVAPPTASASLFPWLRDLQPLRPAPPTNLGLGGLAGAPAGPAVSAPRLRALAARDHFRYLPPAGLVPLATAGGDRGVDAEGFFTGIPAADIVHIPAAKVEPLLRAAAAYPPVDTRSGEALWRYRLAENAVPPQGGRHRRSAVLFATGHLHDIGAAQHDLGRYDAANRPRRTD